MGRLTSTGLHGIWAGITMTWDEKYRFDEDTYAANVEKMCKENIHGVYTTGSTGEFYALEYEEFCRMVDIQVEICSKYNMPLQIGCCSDCTHKTIKLLEYVAGKSYVGAAQVNLPYWLKMTDREIVQFFRDLNNACPDLPLVHYNIARAKRFLSGNDYSRILDEVPSLIGVKYTSAGSNFYSLQESIIKTPRLSYFVGEDVLVSSMFFGARGCYSSMVGMNPKFVLKMYDLAKNEKWEQAKEMQKTVMDFYRGIFTYLNTLNEGVIDPVIDKGLSVASGCIKGSQRTRPPYIGWSNNTVKCVREWLETNHPHLIYGNSF